MENLNGKTLLITGASRGIGKAIALRAARDGANIVLLAKTTEPHLHLPGTIHTAAQEIEAAGGKALAVPTDIRFEDQIQAALQVGVEKFGGIDILVNNASAIRLTSTESTTMNDFDLMIGVNVRATFCCARLCLPFLKKAPNPHILMIAPPLVMQAKWFQNHMAYTYSKYGMSMCVLGMAEEFREWGIAVNALWPKTVIDTAALRLISTKIRPENCRKPEIVAEAARAILVQEKLATTGQFLIDEDVLKQAGVTDFSVYAYDPKAPLLPDFFLPD